MLAASRWRDGVKAALDPLGRLAVIGVIAAAIAATTWLPFLLRATHHPVSNTGSAFHYLPADGAELTFPMLKFTLLGALCMLGTLWLVVRARSSVRGGRPGHRRARRLPVVAAVDAGHAGAHHAAVVSAAADAHGAAGHRRRLRLHRSHARAGRARHESMPGAAACYRLRPRSDWPGRSRSAKTSPTCCGRISPSPTPTPTATASAATGVRPSSEKFYPSIDAAITQATGKPRDETVVLTADYSFLSYYPYWGFQGLTSHYANPLAQFDKRAAAIKSWSKLKTPDQFIHALDTLPWAPPTVFLMRHGGSAGATSSYTLRLAEDVYPNQPNVRRYTVDSQRRLVRRPTVHRHHDRPVRVGHPQVRAAPLMATETTHVRATTI